MPKIPRQWSIGIFAGNSPTQLRCPSTLRDGVLHARDITDVDAAFVADPFMIERHDGWHLFFEVMDAARRRGVIGLATSRDLRRWSYQQIVLQEPFHLSYPHIFEADGDCYMTVETLGRQCVSLYRGDPFPTRWTFVAPLLQGDYADPSIVWHNDKWWLFVCGAPYRHDVLRLFYSSTLKGLWREHPASPLVVADPRAARPAGRVIHHDGKLIRYAQDCVPAYGTSVRAFSIDELTPERYAEHELPGGPVLGPGAEFWNRSGMHHADVHCISKENWVACVDGWTLESVAFP